MGTLLALFVLAVVGGGPAALAQSDPIVDAVFEQGYYLEDRTQAEAQAVADVRAGLADDTIYLIEVVDDLDPLALADDVQLDVGGTVLVVTPFEIGWASDRYSDADIEVAIDRSLSSFDQSPAAGLRAFAGALPEASATSSGAALGWLVPVGFIVLIAGGVWLLVRRNRGRKEEAQTQRMAEAKAELDEQLAVVSNYILDLADRVAVSENHEAESLYRAATDSFTDVQERLPAADELHEMEELSDRLDETRWQLESTEAKLEGREAPERPIDRPAKCFFDPNHRAGTEEAVITTAAGSQTVSVCRQCKARLERGEKVTPKDITVGGRPVPAPRAPRTHGGSGFDWLDAFQILVGGASIGYDMGRSRPGRRRSSIPGLRTGGRSPAPTRTTRTSRSPRSGRSTRTSSRGSRSRGSRTRSRGSRSTGRRRR